MAVTLTANLTHITDPAVQAIFFDGFTAFQEDFSWLNLAPSNKAQIIHQGMNPAPGYAPHTGGAEIVTRVPKEGYRKTYTWTQVANGLAIERQLVLTLEQPVLDRYLQSMGLAAGQFFCQTAYDILNNGYADTGPDGVSLFSASHPSSVGVQSNLGASALDATALNAAYLLMNGITTDDGLKTTLQASLLLVPQALEAKAYAVTQSQVLDKDLQRSFMQSLGFQVKMSKFLNSPTRWFLADPRETVKLFNLFVLQGPNPEIVMRDPATHNYKQTDLIITAAGYDSWRGVVAGNA